MGPNLRVVGRRTEMERNLHQLRRPELASWSSAGNERRSLQARERRPRSTRENRECASAIDGR
eukprot:3119566-Pleurochrysis_carterae.AAC.1